MSFNGNSTPKTENGKLILEDTANKQSWELVKFAYPPQATDNNSEQRLKLSLKYKFEDPSANAQAPKIQYELNYSFDLTWTTSSQTVSSLFKDEYRFDNSNPEIDKLFPESMNSQREGKLDFRYILRPLPIFESDGKSVEIDKQAHMTGKFSLENTIWTSNTATDGTKDDSAKIGLINWFILSDDNLWKTIQDFYLFNNYNIEAQNSEFSGVISELGLNKKTDQDRKNAGIKF